MTRSTDSRPRRAVRRFTLGSGPLKRGSDRVQMTARVVVVLAFLAAAPLAVLTDTRETTHLKQLAAAQAADRQRTTAVLLHDAPATDPNANDSTDGTTSSQVLARARWSTPAARGRAAQEHEGLVLVAPNTRAGTGVPVWVNRRGVLTHAPLDPRNISGTAAAMAVVPLLGVPGLVWLGYAVLCAVLDVRRDRRWADEWAAVEPGWRAQLP
jgi:hypothetical protein